MVALGAVIGGFIAANWLSTDSAVAISSQNHLKIVATRIQALGQPICRVKYLLSNNFVTQRNSPCWW